ncbi:hypothetical protein AQJ84_27555 [Streptomyces resistomycificus]|nr:hypothetical protein AQJ84_27555 [Streptomyces resistomycificus]
MASAKTCFHPDVVIGRPHWFSHPIAGSHLPSAVVTSSRRRSSAFRRATGTHRPPTRTRGAAGSSTSSDRRVGM